MWNATRKSCYRKDGYGSVKYNVIGIVEKSVAGWWWWMVIDARSGEVRGANRCLNLRSAKKSANEVIQHFCMKLV